MGNAFVGDAGLVAAFGEPRPFFADEENHGFATALEPLRKSKHEGGGAAGFSEGDSERNGGTGGHIPRVPIRNGKTKPWVAA